MSTLAKVYERENLERAWRWIRSNSDAAYKAHFRSAYSRYALADTVLLNDLQERLQLGTYQPEKACKLYIPKRSGILRPYSLLSVEDQIVYQAFVNVIAEQLFPKVKSRYLVETFGHLYAGKTSTWFYRKWSDGYKKFNEAAKDAFNRSLRFSASFDLTACYDSLDHGVLKYFLKNIGCDQDLCMKITDLLTMWTATDHQIFHGHGIPQGPLGSGLLSEVVLQHFDQHYGTHTKLRYLRYVDDIRLFATNENDLRKMLVKLDTLSKDVGLFPQSSKIEIHEVKDIDAELKTISTPPETSIKRKKVDQVKLRKRLIELSPHLEIPDQNLTRFKYVLANAEPHWQINMRLIRIYDKRPDLIANIAGYFERYDKLPTRVGDWLLKEIGKDQLYPAVHSQLITLAQNRLKGPQKNRANKLIKKLWTPNLRPDLMTAVGRWALSEGMLTQSQAAFAFRKKKSWWAQANLFECLSIDHYGTVQVTNLLNEGIQDASPHVALAAAVKIIELGCKVQPPLQRINRQAGLLLREFGMISRAPGRQCGIDLSMTSILGKSVAGIDWKQIFGSDHRKVEVHAIWCKAYALTNVTAFVHAMDVFNDWLLIRLYAHDTTVGTYMPGKIGSILSSTRLQTAYPNVLAMVKDIHSHRYESHLSHAKVQKTGKPTSFIPFRYLKKAKILMRAAFLELKRKWDSP